MSFVGRMASPSHTSRSAAPLRMKRPANSDFERRYSRRSPPNLASVRADARRRAHGSVERAAPGLRRRCSSVRVSQDDRFEIGLHDALDSEAFRDAVELAEVEALAAPRFGERFERDVESDRIPEAEAVRDRPGDAVDV